MQLTFIVVAETLNISLTLQRCRFTELKNTNDTDKKGKENGLQQLKVSFEFLSFYQEQSLSLVHYVFR